MSLCLRDCSFPSSNEEEKGDSPPRKKIKEYSDKEGPESPERTLESVEDLERKKGEFFDVASLFSSERNYLVRRDGEQVFVDSLSGKIILIFGLYIPVLTDDYFGHFRPHIMESYRELSKELDDFEIVVVAVMRPGFETNETAFNDFFSAFLSRALAVPFWDSESRARLCEYLRVADCYPDGLIVDKTGKILQVKKPFFFEEYGPYTYPFTDERLKEIDEEDQAIWNKPTLETLLDCRTDFVITNPYGLRVPISDLKQKVVGLYLCIDGHSIERINEVHQKCKALGHEFEIVVIYNPFHWENWSLYWDRINYELRCHNIPHWLVLPYSDKVSRRLWRYCCLKYQDTLIIVQPNGARLDYYAIEIMRDYGVDGYPFTREGIRQKNVEWVEGLTLRKLLASGTRDYVIRSNHDKVPISDLEHRNIFVLFDYVRKPFSKNKLWKKLLERYDEFKKKDETFEVVFVCLDLFDGISFDVHCASMPWLAVPYDRDHTNSISKKIFFKSTIFAFGSDGRIRSIFGQDYLESAIFPTDCRVFDEVTIIVDGLHDYMFNAFHPARQHFSGYLDE